MAEWINWPTISTAAIGAVAGFLWHTAHQVAAIRQALFGANGKNGVLERVKQLEIELRERAGEADASPAGRQIMRALEGLSGRVEENKEHMNELGSKIAAQTQAGLTNLEVKLGERHRDLMVRVERLETSVLLDRKRGRSP